MAVAEQERVEDASREAERTADELQERSERVGDQIDQTREDWDKAKKSEKTPTAAGDWEDSEPDDSTGDDPSGFDDPESADDEDDDYDEEAE